MRSKKNKPFAQAKKSNKEREEHLDKMKIPKIQIVGHNIK
jgi:hypothetical protein